MASEGRGLSQSTPDMARLLLEAVVKDQEKLKELEQVVSRLERERDTLVMERNAAFDSVVKDLEDQTKQQKDQLKEQKEVIDRHAKKEQDMARMWEQEKISDRLKLADCEEKKNDAIAKSEEDLQRAEEAAAMNAVLRKKIQELEAEAKVKEDTRRSNLFAEMDRSVARDAELAAVKSAVEQVLASKELPPTIRANLEQALAPGGAAHRHEDRSKREVAGMQLSKVLRGNVAGEAVASSTEVKTKVSTPVSSCKGSAYREKQARNGQATKEKEEEEDGMEVPCTPEEDEPPQSNGGISGQHRQSPEGSMSGVHTTNKGAYSTGRLDESGGCGGEEVKATNMAHSYVPSSLPFARGSSTRTGGGDGGRAGPIKRKLTGRVLVGETQEECGRWSENQATGRGAGVRQPMELETCGVPQSLYATESHDFGGTVRRDRLGEGTCGGGSYDFGQSICRTGQVGYEEEEEFDPDATQIPRSLQKSQLRSTTQEESLTLHISNLSHSLGPAKYPPLGEEGEEVPESLQSSQHHNTAEEAGMSIMSRVAPSQMSPHLLKERKLLTTPPTASAGGGTANGGGSQVLSQDLFSQDGSGVGSPILGARAVSGSRTGGKREAVIEKMTVEEVVIEKMAVEEEGCKKDEDEGGERGGRGWEKGTGKSRTEGKPLERVTEERRKPSVPEYFGRVVEESDDQEQEKNEEESDDQEHEKSEEEDEEEEMEEDEGWSDGGEEESEQQSQPADDYYIHKGKWKGPMFRGASVFDDSRTDKRDHATVVGKIVHDGVTKKANVQHSGRSRHSSHSSEHQRSSEAGPISAKRGGRDAGLLSPSATVGAKGVYGLVSASKGEKRGSKQNMFRSSSAADRFYAENVGFKPALTPSARRVKTPASAPARSSRTKEEEEEEEDNETVKRHKSNSVGVGRTGAERGGCGEGGGGKGKRSLSLSGAGYAAGKDGSKAFKFNPVVRNTEERKNMKVMSCKQCESFCNAATEGLNISRSELCKCSRHRVTHTPPQTPDGFWEVGIGTQLSQEIAERAKPQDFDPQGQLGFGRRTTSRGQFAGHSVLTGGGACV